MPFLPSTTFRCFYLGQLGLEVLHLSLQGSLLPHGSGEGGIFRVEQGLQVPQPGQSRLQVTLLFSVPVTTPDREDVDVRFMSLQ